MIENCAQKSITFRKGLRVENVSFIALHPVSVEDVDYIAARDDDQDEDCEKPEHVFNGLTDEIKVERFKNPQPVDKVEPHKRYSCKSDHNCKFMSNDLHDMIGEKKDDQGMRNDIDVVLDALKVIPSFVLDLSDFN